MLLRDDKEPIAKGSRTCSQTDDSSVAVSRNSSENVVGSNCIESITESARKSGKRLELRSHQLQFRDGELWAVPDAKALPVRLAAAPRGCAPAPDATLIITSQRIGVLGLELHTKCSYCGEFRPLLLAGLRTMPSGTLRNQPRCVPCRSKRARSAGQNASSHASV